MIKCVLDTNVILSGIVIPESVPGTVPKAGLAGKYQLVISEEMLEEVEVEYVTEYPKIKKWLQRRGKPLQKVRVAVKYIRRVSVATPGNLKLEVIEADSKHNMILASAVEGKADFIVSGDEHLKALKVYERITILDLARFLEKIAADE